MPSTHAHNTPFAFEKEFEDCGFCGGIGTVWYDENDNKVSHFVAKHLSDVYDEKCPECNGEGVVEVLEYDPKFDREHEHDYC